jgi:RND superfamily putative drug exporter
MRAVRRGQGRTDHELRENFVRSGRARESVHKGYSQSGRVVTAAAIIMISVFGAFVTDRDPVVMPIGLLLAFGVLADAFIVRMTLVPDVDIERETVTHGLKGASS